MNAINDNTRLGLEAFRAGSYSEAVTFLRQARLLGADSIEVFIPLGIALTKLGQYQQAAHILEDLIDKTENETTRNAFDIFFNLGLIYSRLGRYKDAFDMYIRARELIPSDRDLITSIAELYRFIGAYDDSIKTLKEFTSEHPNDVDACIELAHTYIDSKHFALAVELLGHARELAPDSYSVHFTIGLLADSKKNYSQALEAYSTAVHLAPDEAVRALMEASKARAYLAIKQYSRAYEIYNRLLLMYPDHPNLLFGLAFAEKGLGNVREAISALKKGLNNGPNELGVLHTLSVLQMQTFQFREAVQTILRAYTVHIELMDLKNSLIAGTQKEII